jgi:hypothetical protein
VFWATTTRSPNKSCDRSANSVDSILSASNSKRLLEAAAMKTESLWHHLASFVADFKWLFFVYT